MSVYKLKEIKSTAGSENSSIKTQNDSLKKEIVASTKKYENLLAEYNYISTEFEAVKTEKTLIAGELQSIKASIGIINSKDIDHKRKIAEYEQKLSQRNHEIMRHQEKIEDLNNKYIQYLNECKSKDATISTLKAEVTELHQTNIELETQIHDLNSKLLSESMDNRKIKSEHEEANRCLKQTQDKLNIVQCTLDSLREENNSNKIEKESLENSNLVLHSKMNKLEVEYYSTKSQLMQLESKSKANEKAYKALQEDYNRMLKRQDFIIDSPSNKRTYKSNFTSLNNTMLVTTLPPKKSPEQEPKRYNDTKYKQNVSTVGEMMKWEENGKKQDYKTGNRQSSIDNRDQVAEIEAKILEISSEKLRLEAEYSKFSSKITSMVQRKRRDEIYYDIELADQNLNKLKHKLREISN